MYIYVVLDPYRGSMLDKKWTIYTDSFSQLTTTAWNICTRVKWSWWHAFQCLTYRLLPSYSYHLSQCSDHIEVVIESSQMKWHVTIIFGEVDALFLLSNKVFNSSTRGTRWWWNAPLIQQIFLLTHGKNPILAASWIGVKSRKFSREGSAPASSNMDTDSFFWANTAQWRAVSPSES